MNDRLIQAKRVANQIIYFIWHRGNKESEMKVTNRLEAINLTNKDAVACAESNMFAGNDTAVNVC